jgi:uncharacterized protein with HEPN domain
MELEIKTWIYDILTAIHEVETFLMDIRGFADYQQDIKTQRAVERNLEIIGEAMNRILKHDSALPFTNARRIVETRNRIIHGYDTVSDEILWSIITTHLPVLKSEAERYLNE